jgi:hypothetical protein
MAGERLSQARAIQNEINIRTKSENSRRAAMNIPVANMKPRPELATTDVQIQLIRAVLGAAKNSRDTQRAIGIRKPLEPLHVAAGRQMYCAQAATPLPLPC